LEVLSAAVKGGSMRVGIIGCGLVSEKHISHLRRIKDIDIVGVCDIDKAKAQRTAIRFGIRNAYREVSEILSEQAPDVVHLLTPPQTHKELSVQAMEAGCRVLVEKPMALNLKEAEEMISASRLYGVTLGVCHNLLFEPAVVIAKELVAKGAIGRVLSADIFWRIFLEGGYDRYQTTQWICDLPGGVFHEIAAHPVYLLMAFFKDLRVASAILKQNPSAIEYRYDELRVLFDGESGMASLSISVSANPRQVFMRIYGTKMTLHLDFTTNSLMKLRRRGAGKISTGLVNIDQGLQLFLNTTTSAIKAVRGRLSNGHGLLIENFYANILEEKEPPVAGEEGKAVVAVLDRIWEEFNGISSEPKD
jgi:predicted dehydrogenase